MKRVLFTISVLLAIPLYDANAQDNGGGGTGGTSCKYCKYNMWGGNYTCPTSAATGRQGDCEITYHMGEYICREPDGPICFFGSPLPTPPPVIA